MEDEQVVICKAGRPWWRPVPYEGQAEVRQLKAWEGQIWMTEDCNEDDEELIGAVKQPLGGD